MKKLLQQALDALENIPTSFGNVAYTATTQQAIEALHAAIAQRESEQCHCDAMGIGEHGVTCGDCPRDYKVQGEKKPVCVARIEVLGKDWRLDYLSLPVGMHNLYAQEYIYAAPVHDYVPLSDDDIIKIAEQHLVLIDNGEFEFARAVERAVRGVK